MESNLVPKRRIEIDIGPMIKDYNAGMSFRALEKKYYISYSVIYRRFKEAEIELRRLKASDRFDKKYLRELFKRSSVEELANFLRMPKSTLYNLLKRHKIVTRRSGPESRNHWRIKFMWKHTHNKSFIARVVKVSVRTVYNIVNTNDESIEEGDRDDGTTEF